jgi:hypothetical protein
MKRVWNAIIKRGAVREDAGCPVCLGKHDEEIHEATLNVRQWFRSELTKRTEGGSCYEVAG